MKYIVKSKGANKYRALESISEFSTAEFETYELYQVVPINPNKYAEILKQQKIEELKTALKALGVDINSLIPQEQQQIQPVRELTNESPLLIAAGAESRPYSNAAENSKIMNKEFGRPFTMTEMRSIFDEFKSKIEKEVQEIMYSTCGPDGFKLVMSEPRTDLPKCLPNGIPLIQVVG